VCARACVCVFVLVPVCVLCVCFCMCACACARACMYVRACCVPAFAHRACRHVCAAALGSPAPQGEGPHRGLSIAPCTPHAPMSPGPALLPPRMSPPAHLGQHEHHEGEVELEHARERLEHRLPRSTGPLHHALQPHLQPAPGLRTRAGHGVQRDGG